MPDILIRGYQWVAESMNDINTFSIILRLTMALVCGSIIGLERGRKGRAAGFRTHVLVCIGAAMAMMTNQFIFETYNTGDMTRMGAQVISGIGFLGAGTIIVTGRNKIKGLTTAASLWACACLGLAIGIGFYSAAFISCLLVWCVNSVLHRLEEPLQYHSKVMSVYMELSDIKTVRRFISEAKAHGVRVTELELMKTDDELSKNPIGATMTLRTMKKVDHQEVKIFLSSIEGVAYVEFI